MNEIVKICKKHGNLTEDLVFKRKNRNSLECRQCIRERERNRPKRVYEGDFAHYHREYAKKWRSENKDYMNAKIREDRKNNPEKYREWEQNKRYKNIDKSRYRDVLKKHKITKEEYEQIFSKHNGLCAICKRHEKRLSRNGVTTTRISLDHCHMCEDRGYEGIVVIRGMLCGACNKAIGLLEDNIDLLKSAIQYLESHQHHAIIQEA